jgi:hypothetical protein
MRQVRAEHRYGVAVRAKRLQADRLLTGTQSCQEIVYIHWTPLPRKLTFELLEPFQQLAALLDGLRCEPAGQHLCAPAIQHGGEDTLVGPEQPDIQINQHPRDETRHDTTHGNP